MPAAVGELKQCSLWQRGVPKPCSAALAPGPPFSRCASNFVIFYYVFVCVVCICVYIFMFDVPTDRYPLLFIQTVSFVKPGAWRVGTSN